MTNVVSLNVCCQLTSDWSVVSDVCVCSWSQVSPCPVLRSWWAKSSSRTRNPINPPTTQTPNDWRTNLPIRAMSQCLLATTQEVRHKDTRTREMCSAVTEPTVFVSKHKTDRGDTRSFLRLPQNIDTKDEFGLSCSRTNCQRESFCANLSNCCHIKQKYDLKKYESPPNQQHHFKKKKKKVQWWRVTAASAEYMEVPRYSDDGEYFLCLVERHQKCLEKETFHWPSIVYFHADDSCFLYARPSIPFLDSRMDGLDFFQPKVKGWGRCDLTKHICSHYATIPTTIMTNTSLTASRCHTCISCK